jgi:peptidyl-prolyl cis-trans isomerase A (cyclophilin A)
MISGRSETLADTVRVLIETELGNIEAEIEVERAPVTAGNFLRYVDADFYDGGIWHRTVLPDNQPDNDIWIEVIQGGVCPEREDERFAPIPLERTTITGLSHRDGTISMSRFSPDSAVSDIFICIGDQPSLDFGGLRNPDGQGFAAFGQVTQGMDVVRAIQHSAHEEQRLTPPVAIIRVTRHEE